MIVDKVGLIHSQLFGLGKAWQTTRPRSAAQRSGPSATRQRYLSLALLAVPHGTAAQTTSTAEAEMMSVRIPTHAASDKSILTVTTRGREGFLSQSTGRVWQPRRCKAKERRADPAQSSTATGLPPLALSRSRSARGQSRPSRSQSPLGATASAGSWPPGPTASQARLLGQAP